MKREFKRGAANQGAAARATIALACWDHRETFHAGQLPADLRTSLISLLSARLRVASGGKILPVTVGGIEPTGAMRS